jgi:hypothetical protein
MPLLNYISSLGRSPNIIPNIISIFIAIFIISSLPALTPN